MIIYLLNKVSENEVKLRIFDRCLEHLATWGAYLLTNNPGNFSCKGNEAVISQKIHLAIVDHIVGGPFNPVGRINLLKNSAPFKIC